MVIPRSMARFNRVVTNRVTAPMAGWLPGFGVVLHQGRRSGRQYQTPINVFRVPNGYVAALTYGPDTDWVKSVLAAGGCELKVHGERVRLTDPRIVHDEARHDMPPVVRGFLGVIGVTDFLYLACRHSSPAPSIDVNNEISEKRGDPP